MLTLSLDSETSNACYIPTEASQQSKANMGKQDTTKTGGATSSTTELPHDEEVAKLFQALMRMASPELDGTNRRLKYLKVFINLSPPEYRGNLESSSAAMDWLRRVKKCFNIIDVPGDLRVGFAAYTLTGAADYWWEFVESTRDVESMTWDDFEQIFVDRYVPQTIMLEKEEEFLTLTQGEMTVFQYDSKFIELSRYASHLLTLEKERARQFLRGLRPSIRVALISCMCDTYQQAVAAALEAEKSENIDHQSVEESFEGASGILGKRQRKQYICHNCGEPGHIRPQCPYNP